MSVVVDGHLHLFRSCSEQFPRTVYDIMAPADREERADKLIAAMESAGVDHAVVVPLSKEDDYLREVLTTFPGRFAGVGIFEHERPDDVPSMERRLEATDIQGLRFYGLGADESTTMESLNTLPIFDLMAEREMVVWFYGDVVQLRLMDRIMRRLPHLKVVLNHSGFLPDMHAEMKMDVHRRPHFDVTLPPDGLAVVELLAAEHENLHVHFSGHYAFSSQPYPYRDLVEVSQRLLAAFGSNRMLMASDWPWIELEPGYAEVLGVVDELLPEISPDERAAIRGGTAASLFRF